jgi:hypothetical protein
MRFHQQILDQLFGVDINQFPAHLTVINLAIQNPKSKIEKVNVAISDIFDVKPKQATLMGFKSVSAEGSSTLVKMPPSFDAVIANPPYIRQELLGDKEKLKIKSLIENEYKDKLFIGVPKKKIKNAVVLGKQSDIYIYFYIHALKFLKNGRRLGYISSNKWLEVGYGRGFQKFLLGHTKIEYIIEFDSAVFPDAEVNTAIVILEKAEGEANKSLRLKNKCKFVHIKKAIPIEQLIDRLQNEEKINDATISLVTIEQGKIKPGKWNIFSRAPPVYFEVLKNPLLKPLEKVLDIKYGIKSGYDPYFILNKEKIEEWKIEDRFLKPCAPPGKLLRGFKILPSDVRQYFLIVHEEESKLQGTNVLNYIKFGEKSDAAPSKRRKDFVRLPEVETVKSRPQWYSLSEPPAPSLLFPMWFRYRYHPLLNDAKVHATDFYYYIITDESEKEILAALLYSTLTQFLLELGGRQYSGMLHTKVYELKNLPFIDPRDFDKYERERLKTLALELNDAMTNRNVAEEKLSKFAASKTGERGLFEKEFKEEFEKTQTNECQIISQIDKIIYDKLKLTDEQRRAISTGLTHLRTLRKSATRGMKTNDNKS